MKNKNHSYEKKKGYEVSFKNAQFSQAILDLINGKKQETLRLPIPEEKKQDVTNFLTDLEEFFSGEENGKE